MNSLPRPNQKRPKLQLIRQLELCRYSNGAVFAEGGRFIFFGNKET